MTIHSLLMVLTLWNWKHKLIDIHVIKCDREYGEWIEMTENDVDWYFSIDYALITHMNECKTYLKKN